MAKKSTRSKRLVIVESPAKAKTINKYLGDDYVVRASMGHVRDLPSKGMGVDLKTFQPDYEVLSSRSKVIGELKKLARDVDEVFLATDLDREGEAIAWHLKEALGLPDDRVRRVIFNAITRAEIQKAFAQPHSIDMDRVNAQQARRILDRVVGYEISPLLWRKVARGLSAGRVQSVAVRLVVDREREIERFVPEEYWTIGAVFVAGVDASRAAELANEWSGFCRASNGEEPTRVEKDRWLADHGAFQAQLVEFSGQKFEPKSIDQASRVARALGFVVTETLEDSDTDARGAAHPTKQLLGTLGELPTFVVRSIEKKRTTSRPAPPFITSTLQQAASSRLGFGAQRTMRVAQSLYEAGHITYMRTDSTNLSAEALSMVREFVQREFGDDYLPPKPNVFSSSNKSAQEAHEAIRPTDLALLPEDARGKLSTDESRLYQLIYNRFVACQMSPAQFDQTTVLIDADSPDGLATFRASGRKLVFDGFMRVAGISSEDQLLPELHERDEVRPLEIQPTQHFTQPPPRYTEASLVKELESKGIGRPSTYASIIQTIQDREYVTQIERRFHATLLGKVVTDKLIEAFPEIMDVGFTADMELKLDRIEDQHLDWVKLLQDFYGPFHGLVNQALEKLEHAGGTRSEHSCPKCGKPMVYRISKNGFFLACSDRECGSTQPVDIHGNPLLREETSVKCPKCGRPMIKRRGRFGEFLGCSGYSEKDADGKPLCSVIINLDKQGNPLPPKPAPIQTGVACEKCGAPMLLRDSKRGPFLGCSRFPKCRSTKMVSKLPPEQREQVEQLVPMLKDGAQRSEEMIAKIVGGTRMTATPRPQQVPTDIDCEECGKPMIVRHGKRGLFLGCSGYPKCRNTGEVPAKLLEELEKAGITATQPASASPTRDGDADQE